MSTSILVGYATRYGSTQEVAETVAATLHEGGLAVDIQLVRDVRTLAGYNAVVLGAPLFIGKWHNEAHRFLKRHREALTERPVAIFALGPISTDAQAMLNSRGQLDKELAKYSWLRPVALEMFVGKYDPERLTFPHNLIARSTAGPLYGVPASDHRDWTAIRAWASSLAATLEPALP